MFNHRAKKRILRTISASLASLMLLTSVPISTYAETEGDNTEGSVSSGTAHTYKGTGWVDTRQGYRFYIIDTNCTRQSDVFDFVFEMPTNVPDTKWFTNSRYEAPRAGDYSQYKMASISSLINDWCAGSVNASGIQGIPPLLILKCVNGGEFQEWFIGKHGGGSSGGSLGVGAVRPSQNSSLNGAGSSSGKNMAMLGDLESFLSEVECVECELGWGTGPFNAGNASRLNYIKNNSSYVSTYFVDRAQRLAQEMKKVYNNVYSQTRNLSGTKFGYGTVSTSQLKSHAYYEAYSQVLGSYWMSNSKYASTLTTAVQYFFDGGSKQNLLDLRKGTTSSGSKRPTSSVKANTDADSLLFQNIPLASAVKYPADKFLTNDALKVYGFNEDVDGSGTVNAMDALKYKDANGNYKYYLVVEPLAWINIYTSKTTYEPTRTYGTYYNLVEYMATHTSNDNAAGPHNSYFKQYGKNSLQVNTSYDEMARPILAKETDAKLTISQVYDAMHNRNIGYGMHVYCASDFDSGTSTFDEPLGDNPGPAPDDSKDLSDPEKSNKKQHANIVKFYESYVSGKLDFSDSFNREVTPKTILIEDEISYKVTDWFTSTTYKPAGGSGPKYESYKSSLSNKQSGKSPTSVELKDETTLYVKLVKEDETEKPIVGQTGDWVVSESRLTKIAKTANTDEGKDVSSTVVFNITYPELSQSHGGCYCDGHTKTTTNEDGTTSSSTYHCGGCVSVDRSLEDSDAEIIWKNAVKGSYSKLMSTLDDDEVWGEKWNKHYTGNRQDNAAETDELTGVTYDFLLHRAGYDKTMIFTGKKELTSEVNTVEPNLLTLQFVEGKTGSPKRTNASNKYAIGLNFSDDAEKSDNFTSSVCDRCGDTHTDDNTTITQLDINGSVVINTYAGIKSSTRNNTDCDTSEVMYVGTSGYNRASGRMVCDGKTFRFVPYIQMQYDNLNTQNIKTLVTGQFERAMTVNDYAEVAWNTAPVGNLHVTSNQWSAHAGALDLSAKLLGTPTPNIMLPGGALYSLDTKGTEQEVQISTYQTVLIGNGLEQAQAISQDLSQLGVDVAKTDHEDYVQSVLYGLTNVAVKQYVDKDADSDSALHGTHVYPGADISSLQNGSAKASTDSKYYFVDDPSGSGSLSNENDLDAWVTKPTTAEYYTFYSDVKGNIHMAKVNESGSPLNDTVIISKNQGIQSLSDYKALEINNRTLVVTKLLEAIERNTGNDPAADWVSDGHWYNEAFNGVTVMIQRTKINVGMYDPSIRSTILDPKLIPQQKSKQTMFKNAFISQFETADQSAVYTKPNVVGSFKGQDIQMRDLKFLFQSNTFFIPDANVQDLS